MGAEEGGSGKQEARAAMERRAKGLLLRSQNCAQAVFATLCEGHDLDGGPILRALTPFPGLALRGETCGAVTGALLALGLVYGRDELTDWKGYLRSLPPARRFCSQFAAENGGTACRTILEANILGMSCARVCPVEVLCVGDCVYTELGAPPIQIGKLQRYATDAAYAAGWRFFEAGPDTGRSVALVGAGPASLAAAHELRRRGHACTLYEKRPLAGGLNLTGVAPYKLRADRAAEEVDYVLGIGGVELRAGVEVGVDVSFAELEARHDAVFVGFGLGLAQLLLDPGGIGSVVVA